MLIRSKPEFFYDEFYFVSIAYLFDSTVDNRGESVFFSNKNSDSTTLSIAIKIYTCIFRGWKNGLRVVVQSSFIQCGKIDVMFS